MAGLLALLLSVAACIGGEDPLDADAEVLGTIGSKADGPSVREVELDLAPGEIRRFRVTAVRFFAEVDQSGSVPAHLSAKHYEIELESTVRPDPAIEADAPEPMLRNWTLRVHNDGSDRLRGLLTVRAIEELDAGSILRETEVSVGPRETQRFRIAGASIRAELVTDPETLSMLSAKHYDIEAASDPDVHPVLTVESPGGETRNWTVRVTNLTDDPLEGRLTVRVLDEPDPEPRRGRPTLDDPILDENEICTYGDNAPYVREVRWEHPLVKAAMSQLVNGFRSTFSYTEWRVAYGLESDRTGTDTELADARARNWIRVACGEHRDYPELLIQKLEAVAGGQHYAGPREMTSVDTSRNLFTQLTTPAYHRLVDVMRAMHTYRSRRGSNDGYHYGKGRFDSASNRVDHSVPPWTQCEMKFAFEHYLVSGSPTTIDGARFEADYADYRDRECTAEDLEWMFNFRGHVNFQPLWLESNGFNFNSRRARGAEISRDDRDYYFRPFATRYHAARQAWATYLFHRDEDHGELMRASDTGGGPILYILDEDADEDGVADYKLFDENGCGDQGVGLPVPSQNCNMVSWEEALRTTTTTGHARTWDPRAFDEPGMGFLEAFGSFEERMSRLNQAFDRHTNWGPTGYYMTAASDPDDLSPRFYGAYSPVVAASYDVSASDFFVHRDYDTTDSFERGRAKWLHVMRFRAVDYYDEEDLAAGAPIDFDRHYFNETSLSNDYYDERALDHWGYIPGEEAYAQVYLTYGDRGENPPAPREVPAP